MGVALLHEMLLSRISTACISSYQFVLLVLSRCILRVHVLPSTLCTPVRPCRYLHDCVLYIMLLCRYSWSTIWSRAIHPDPPVACYPLG